MAIEVDKKKILKFVLNRFEIMKRGKEKIDERAYKNYKIYNLLLDEDDLKRKEDWQANIIDAYSFILCESILPNIYDAFFQSEKFVDIVGQSESAIEKELKVEEILHYFLEKSRLRQKAIDIIRSAIKYPAAIIKLRYEYKVSKRIVLQDNGNRNLEEYIEYDGPNFELVPIWDFFIDPQATTIENARDIIHRSIKDYNELLKEAEEFNNILGDDVYDIEAIKELKKSSFIPDVDNLNPVYEYGYQKIDTDEEYYKNIELLEYWGRYDINNDGRDEDVLVLVANREKIIKISEVPYMTIKKPFIEFKIISKENEFWGHSIPELIESDWEEINAWRGLRMDSARLNLFPPMLVPVDIDLADEDLKIEPGLIIRYNPIGEKDLISFLKLPSSQLPSQIEIQDLKQSMQQTAGPTDPIMGSNVGRGVNKTARGISIIASASMARINMMVQELAPSFKKLIKYYLQFLKQYMSNSIRIRQREEFIEISPEDLFGEFEYRINFRDVKQNIELEKQEIINLISILGQIPGTNVYLLIRILLEYFPRLKGKIEQILREPGVTGQIPLPAPQQQETLFSKEPTIRRPAGNVNLPELSELT